MGRFARLVLLLLALSGLLAVPAPARIAAASISIVDDHGTRLTLAAPPRRIISLAPNVTEILFALGLGPRVVGVSSFSDYPAAARRLPAVIDYTHGANTERILALKPDLLIAAGIVSPQVIAKLRSLHLAVLVTDPADLKGILHDIALVGAAAGVPGTAATVVAGLQRRIDAVTVAVGHSAARPRVYYEVDTTLYTAGHGSFIDALIAMAGGTNIAGTVMNPYPQLSAEKIISADPQYIILGDAAYGGTVAAVSARPGWSVISAVRLHHVYPFDDNLASRPGPRIVDGLERLAHLIHPEDFR